MKRNERKGVERVRRWRKRGEQTGGEGKRKEKERE